MMEARLFMAAVAVWASQESFIVCGLRRDTLIGLIRQNVQPVYPACRRTDRL